MTRPPTPAEEAAALLWNGPAVGQRCLLKLYDRKGCKTHWVHVICTVRNNQTGWFKAATNKERAKISSIVKIGTASNFEGVLSAATPILEPL